MLNTLIDLSHPLNTPHLTTQNPNDTPPYRSSTLPLSPYDPTPIREFMMLKWSQSSEAGPSNHTISSPVAVEDIYLPRSDFDTSTKGSHRQVEKASGGQNDTDDDDDDEVDIVDVSNTQWNAAVMSKQARDDQRSGSVRSSSVLKTPHSDHIFGKAAEEISHLQDDKAEGVYWKQKEERLKPKRNPTAALTSKCNLGSSPSGLNVPCTTRPLSESDSTSPLPWSPSPPRNLTSSHTSVSIPSSPKLPDPNENSSSAKLSDLFNTPPKASAPARRPLREIQLSDTEEEEFDLTSSKVRNKGKGKAIMPIPSYSKGISANHTPSEDEEDIPEDMAWAEAQDATAEYDDFEINEAELDFLFEKDNHPSTSRKRRRPTPFMVDDHDENEPSNTSNRNTSRSGPLSELNLPTMLNSPGNQQSNVAGTHYSALSASMDLSHPLMFISDLSSELQDFYLNHGKGLAKRSKGTEPTGGKGASIGSRGELRNVGELRRGEVMLVENDTHFEGVEDDDWDEDIGPQRPSTARKRGRGAASSGRGKRGWGRGRGGFRGRSRGRGRVKR